MCAGMSRHSSDEGHTSQNSGRALLLTKLREDAYIKYADGYVDTGKSANQTLPVETAAAKESDAKKLSKKKTKKFGIL
jgi:hypothetical protein